MLAGLWMLSNRLGRGQLRRPTTGCGSSSSTSSAFPSACCRNWSWCGWSTGRWSAVWPQTFSRSRVERNARDLYDQGARRLARRPGLIVVIGAPFVEELIYRGLLQGALVRRLNDAVAVVAVAAFFALIHFRWVEFPGCSSFGLVLGVCALRTGRLGMGIVAHMAFNATGLMLVARA